MQRHNTPASTLVELPHPRRFTTSCISGPIAIVPKPLPAVTIPFARLMRLKEQRQEDKYSARFIISRGEKKTLLRLRYRFYLCREGLL